MKSFKIAVTHPVHGDMHAYGSTSPKDGVKITHYGHGGEYVAAEDAHGSHEGGINEKQQEGIKNHVMKVGAGDHASDVPHHMEKCIKCEGGKSEAADMPKDLNKEPHTLEKKYEGFKAVEESAKKSGASDPGAVAASIGRKKYGKAAFQHAAAEGKKMKKSEYEAHEVAVALIGKLSELVEDLEKIESKDVLLTNKGRNPWDNGKIEPVVDQSINDAAGTQKIDEPKVTGNINDAADDGNLEQMKRDGKYNKDKKMKKGEKNPDEKADAKLGESVEHLVEDHVADNKAAERQEGHKILGKTEKLQKFMDARKK